jgi:hypothetical protein
VTRTTYYDNHDRTFGPKLIPGSDDRRQLALPMQPPNQGGRTRVGEQVKLATPTEKVIIVAETHAQAMQLAYDPGYRTQGQTFRYVIVATGDVHRLQGLDRSIPYYVMAVSAQTHETIQFLTMRGHERRPVPEQHARS